MIRIPVILILICLVTLHVEAGEYDWRVEHDFLSGLLDLHLHNTSGSTPYDVVLALKPDITPKSITLNFPNGFTRPGTSGEMDYFWRVSGAQKKVWNYLHEKGQLNTLSLTDSAEIPIEMFGNNVLCVMKTGKQFMGLLLAHGSNRSRFKIKAMASEPLDFYIPAVKEIWSLR